MRLHFRRESADHLHTEEGEPQPFSFKSRRTREPQPRPSALFLRFFARRRAFSPHRPQNPQAFDFSIEGADSSAASSAQPHEYPPPADAKKKLMGVTCR